MKKLVVSLLVGTIMLAAGVLALAVPQLNQQPSSVYAYSGSGTIDSPFLLSTRADLDGVLRNNAGIAGRHFRMTSDINVSASAWTPITTFAAGNTFDGGGYSIIGLHGNWGSANGGLFGTMAGGGTIRNLTIHGGNVTSTASRTGFLVGLISSAGVYNFENINIASGHIHNVTGSEVGGVLGSVSTSTNATTVNFTDVQNHASVNSQWSNGGILGMANGNANLHVNFLRVLNTGNVTNNQTSSNSQPGAGGMIGTMWTGPTVTMDFVINRGIMRRNNGTLSIPTSSAGIVGSANGGTATIRNAINTGTTGFLTTGTTPNFGILGHINSAAMTVHMQNAQFITGLGATAATNTSPRVLTSQNVLPFATVNAAVVATANTNRVGPNAVDGVFFLDAGNNITLEEFRPAIRFNFEDQNGDLLFMLGHPRSEPVFTMPNQATEGAVIPNRTGFVFAGWELNGTPVGPTYTHSDENRTFTIVHSPINYDIVFASDSFGTPSADQSIRQIGQTIVLSAGIAWDPEYRWLVRSNTGGYELAGSTDNLAVTLTEAFLVEHALENNSIVFRLVNVATSTSINVTGASGVPTNAGFLQITYTLDGNVANAITVDVQLGTTLSIPNLPGAAIIGIESIANNHYSFTSIEVLNATGGQEFASVNANWNDGPMPLSLATLAGIPDRSIRVNFEAMVYTFDTIAQFRFVDSTADSTEVLSAITNQEPIILGQGTSVTVMAPELVGFRFVRWILGDMELSFLDPIFTLDLANVNEAFLAQHLNAGQITLIAEYYETISISVLIASTSAGAGELDVVIYDRFLGRGDTYGYLENAQVVFGSQIRIEAHANRMFMFNGFDVSSAEMDGPTTAFITVMSPRTVTASFVNRSFAVRFETVDANGARLPNVPGIFEPVLEATVGGSVVTQVNLGNILSAVQPTAPAGHRFAGFFFRNTADVLVPFDSATNITETFLDNHLSVMNDLVISARFIRQVTVTVTIPEAQVDMGSFTINGGDVNTITVDVGSTVTIAASPAQHFQLLADRPFLNVHATEINGQVITLSNLQNPRDITIRFQAQQFTLNPDLDDEITVNRTTLGMNQEFTVTAVVPSGRRISSWTINGVRISDLVADDSLNVTRTGDVVTITFDNAWLTEHQLDLNSEITFAMATGILIAILLPAILIPLLLIAVLLYVLSSRKKYATIKAELVAAQQQKQRFGNDFIKDLREGKSGTVTDQDVKDAMKKKN
ncbi:MAG: hypothetical protein FWE31_01545 [Firmicutes bacterium]|nr:hypothetical protein [Bacillota bacterium]